MNIGPPNSRIRPAVIRLGRLLFGGGNLGLPLQAFALIENIGKLVNKHRQ